MFMNLSLERISVLGWFEPRWILHRGRIGFNLNRNLRMISALWQEHTDYERTASSRAV